MAWWRSELDGPVCDTVGWTAAAAGATPTAAHAVARARRSSISSRPASSTAWWGPLTSSTWHAGSSGLMRMSSHGPRLLKAAMVTSGAITNRIDRLETKGLVERVRDAGDRRSVRIRLTSRGLAVVDEMVGLHAANEERLLAALGPAERERLAGALRTLLESLGDTSLG